MQLERVVWQEYDDARAVCGESRTYGSVWGKISNDQPITTDPMQLYYRYILLREEGYTR